MPVSSLESDHVILKIIFQSIHATKQTKEAVTKIVRRKEKKISSVLVTLDTNLTTTQRHATRVSNIIFFL